MLWLNLPVIEGGCQVARGFDRLRGFLGEFI